MVDTPTDHPEERKISYPKMMHINAKVILKFVCLMGVWSTVLIGLMKLHTNHGIAQLDEEGPGGVKSGRLLLQKETRFFQEATSTTTEKFMPLDVLIDNRTRKSAKLRLHSRVNVGLRNAPQAEWWWWWTVCATA